MTNRPATRDGDDAVHRTRSRQTPGSRRAPRRSWLKTTRATSRQHPATKRQPEPKPKTRAGLPTTEKVPMTIGFSENMEFTGRSVDPEGRPAAQAEFYGMVTAQTEDALLHCTKKMIAYTDREVPLAQLGKMSQGPIPVASWRRGEPPARTAKPRPRPSSRSSFAIATPSPSAARSIPMRRC